MMERMDAGEMAQSVKHLPGKHEALSVIPRTRVNDGDSECCTISMLSRWRQGEPGPRWIASLAQPVNYRLIRDPVSKHKGNNS